MAFDDLDTAETERSSSSEPDDDGSDGGAETETEAARDAEAATASSGRSANDGARTAPAAGDEPAFGFDEAKQRPLYARQKAWDAFEDALAIEVEATLRRNDVRDAPKRELHDAALRVLADHADEVADRVLDERGVER